MRLDDSSLAGFTGFDFPTHLLAINNLLLLLFSYQLSVDTSFDLHKLTQQNLGAIGEVLIPL
jgi:hypothetical protein